MSSADDVHVASMLRGLRGDGGVCIWLGVWSGWCVGQVGDQSCVDLGT